SCLLVHYTPTTLIYTLSLHDALPILLYQHRVLYDRAGHFGGIRRHRRLGRAPDGPQRVLPAAARGRVLAGRGAAAGHRGGPAAGQPAAGAGGAGAAVHGRVVRLRLSLGRGAVAPGAAFRGRAAGAAGGGGAGAVRGAGAGEARGPGGALTGGRESAVVPVSERVGVMVERRTLELARRGRPTHERLRLYRDITLRGGPELVLFSLGDADFRERRVHGFVPTRRGWRRKEAELPAVIHKRVLFPLPVER